MAPSPLSESIAAEQARDQEDWAEAQRQIKVLSDTNTSLSGLVDAAAALDVTQEAEIASVKAERDALMADAADAKAALDAFDLNPSFPAAPTEPAPEPGPGDTPDNGGTNPPPVDPDVPVGTGTDPGAPPPPPDPVPTSPEPNPGDTPGE